MLGGLLLENRLWFELADKLAENDFYRADHRLIFRAIGELIGRQQTLRFRHAVRTSAQPGPTR